LKDVRSSLGKGLFTDCNSCANLLLSFFIFYVSETESIFRFNPGTFLSLHGFLKSSLKYEFFKKESFEFTLKRQNLLFYFFMFVIPLLLTALSLVSANVAGVYFGTNVAYLLIVRKGIPGDTGSTAQRTARVFISLLLLEVSSLILNFWFKPAGTINYLQFTLIGFLKTFIPASTVWASVAVCTKLGLYKKDKRMI